MTVMCARVLTTTMTVIMVLTYMGLAAGLGQHDVVLLPTLISRDPIGGVDGLNTVLQQATSVPDAF